MPAEVFIDTNVVVYSFDASAPDKRMRAKEILRGNKWFVSWQVLQEFGNVALHRFEVPLRTEDLKDYLDLVLWPNCGVFPSGAIFRKALEIHDRFRYRFHDSLIVASALAGGASILYSEDMQDGQRVGPLRIEDPFRS